LVEEIGIFDDKGNKGAVFDLGHRILPEEATTRTEFSVVLEEDEIGASLIIVAGESAHELIGHGQLFLGIGLDGEELRDFFEGREARDGHALLDTRISEGPVGGTQDEEKDEDAAPNEETSASGRMEG
jgi:hypothetical protein